MRASVFRSPRISIPVLIIDEVLSVGDYQFQEKAFGRIHDMARSGIPVVLVSHQLDRVATLCTRRCCYSRGRPFTRVRCRGVSMPTSRGG